MPRSRTEAMLSGCCVLTTPHHDAGDYIEDGVNGFIVPRNPNKVVALIEELLNNYEKAIKVGQAGKETAIKLFNGDRYRDDWVKIISKTLKEYE